MEENISDRTLTIDTKSSAVEAITDDMLILAKVSIILFDESLNEEVAREELEFAIKFETPFVEEVDDEVETVEEED